MGLTLPIEVAGRLGDQAIHRIGLRDSDLDVSILTWGAAIQNIAVQGPRGPRSAVLGFDTCGEYLEHRLYMGCVVGRVANRIAGGRFALDGKTYQLDCNEKNGLNHIHGGIDGFSRRVWTIEAVDEKSVDLKLVSPNGDQGYPGTLTVHCRYSIESGRRLAIALRATTDAATIVNLATHSYFNLDGAGDIRDHYLQIPAQTYLPVDDALIPTGELRQVAGTPFDFRSRRRIGSEGAVVFDNTYVLPDAAGGLRKAARVDAPQSGLAMEVWTTEPGLQFFDGGTMRPLRGRNGVAYGPYSGLCLEPQRFPDSPNHAGFPDIRLYPSQTYSQLTEYRFDVA